MKKNIVVCCLPMLIDIFDQKVTFDGTGHVATIPRPKHPFDYQPWGLLKKCEHCGKELPFEFQEEEE